MITIAALYQFTTLENPEAVRAELHALCREAGIKGTLILAHEGVNGTVAGSRAAITTLHQWLLADGRFGSMEYKESHAEVMPFHRLKVKVKPEIVTLGRPEAAPNKQVGTYVSPKEWDALLQDPDVVVIDTRNHYEIAVGTFPGAISPETEHFRDFPQFVEKNAALFKHKKIAMCCTGGIRCEKASSYMMSQGFEEVYHLKGGILKYLEETPPEESKWEGECFIFDQRVAVSHAVVPGSFSMCYGCRHPLTEAERTSPLYEEGVTCPRCYDTLSEKQKASARERHKQVLLAEKRGDTHIGKVRHENCDRE